MFLYVKKNLVVGFAFLASIAIIFGTTLSVSAATYAIFDTDCNANIGLSGGGLTLTDNTGGAWHSCRANQAKSSGKWYYEVSNIQITSNNGIIGMANSTAPLNVFCGNDTNGFGYYGQGGSLFYNSSDQGPYSSYASGDVIGVAADLDGGTVDFYKNGALTGTYTIQPSGPFYPCQSLITAGDNVTYNFGASAFTTTTPAGFNAGWYEDTTSTPTTTSTINFDVSNFWTEYGSKMLLIGGSLLVLGFYVMIIKVKNGIAAPVKK